jgi:hypothetical protein
MAVLLYGVTVNGLKVALFLLLVLKNFNNGQGINMRLHEQVKQYNNAVQVTEEGIGAIKRYLNLPKFSTDIMVNKNDILLRLEELESQLFNATVELQIINN